MKYYQTFIVITSFTFPVDMLRYDGCFPHSEVDATKISRNLREHNYPLEVKIGRYIDNRHSKPTEGRWESFGCTIKDVETL